MSKQPYPVGPGWWPLLDEKLPEVKKLTDTVYIKEKYGACKVSYDLLEKDGKTLERLYDLSREIEKASIHICENCGAKRKKPTMYYPFCDRCKASSPAMLKLIRERTMEEYYRGSHLRHGEPADRTAVRSKKMKDFAKKED